MRVDAAQHAVHFWDPMMSRLENTGVSALPSATVSRAAMMFMTIITITTRTRGAIG